MSWAGQMTGRICTVLATLGVAAASLGEPAMARPITAEQIVLAPHRAIYDFDLKRTAAGSGVSDMKARMVYELTGSACEGFTQKMRFVTQSSTSDGSLSVNDIRSTSWEEGSGLNFRFNSSHIRDEQPTEATVGDAARAAEEIKIELTKPQKKKTAIAASALFPIQHSREMLAAAQREETVLQANLYDGSAKGEKVYVTTAVIGRERAPGTANNLPEVEHTEKLKSLRSWRVALSYFEPSSRLEDAVPSHELAFLMFENGIVRDLTLDYGDFALRGDLKSLTIFDPPKCATKR